MMQTHPPNCTKITFFLPLGKLWCTDTAGVMNQVVCLCFLWSNAFAMNAPLEPSLCISIVLSMPMLSNTTNASLCYIFLGAFICACLYLGGGGGPGVLWHLSPCWYVSECVRAYGPFLFISEQWVRYTGCWSSRKMKIVMCFGMLVSRWVSCWAWRGKLLHLHVCVERLYDVHLFGPVWAEKNA